MEYDRKPRRNNELTFLSDNEQLFICKLMYNIL